MHSKKRPQSASFVNPFAVCVPRLLDTAAPLDSGSWHDAPLARPIHKVPQQENGYDCAVFAVHNVATVVRKGALVPFKDIVRCLYHAFMTLRNCAWVLCL